MRLMGSVLLLSSSVVASGCLHPVRRISYA